jgi:hypothetical protein
MLDSVPQRPKTAQVVKVNRKWIAPGDPHAARFESESAADWMTERQRIEEALYQEHVASIQDQRGGF